MAAPGAGELVGALGGDEVVALQNLGDINREILLLKDMQGLALEEIAGMLGVPLGTVKSRCNRARIELAQAVIALGGGPGAGAAA